MQADTCYTCRKKGHWSWDCPSKSPNSKSHSPSLNHYSPELVRRMEADDCYKCKKKGHWSWDCPSNSNSPNSKSLSPSLNHYSPELVRRMQAETCYTCKKKGHWSWDCPSNSPNAKSSSPSANHYSPELVRRMQTDDCYKCKKKGHWSWDCPLNSPNAKSPSQSARVYLYEMNPGPVKISEKPSSVAVSKLPEKEDTAPSAAPSKGPVKNSENPASSVAVSKLAEQEDIAPSAAPSKGVGGQEFEVADDLQDPDLSRDASVKEQSWLLSSHQSITSKICYQENVSVERHIFAGAVTVASFGSHCRIGWLGRLLYFNPTQSLKFPPPKPFFCCVFPSFNPIDVPKQVIIGDFPCDTEVSRDAFPNKSPVSERKPMSKAERRRQMVLVAQQQLLIDLETFDPNGQRDASEATFDMLDKLGVNYKQFAHNVWDYIDLASSMAEMDESMKTSLTLDEYNKRFEEEKMRFTHIQDDCFNTETLLEASNQRRQLLIEEISHLDAMLYEKQTQLKYCELENLQIETHLGDLRSCLMEADISLKVTAEEAKIARQLNEERQAKQISAKTALMKAKLEFEN